MGAGTYNMTIEQGSTFTLAAVWKDDDGNVINLTGYTAKMQIRTRDYTKTLVKELSTANGKITISGSHVISLALTATDTAAMTAGVHSYDLELTSGTTVTRLLEGMATVSAEVTV